jgi:hypothetical protein
VVIFKRHISVNILCERIQTEFNWHTIYDPTIILKSLHTHTHTHADYKLKEDQPRKKFANKAPAQHRWTKG